MNKTLLLASVCLVGLDPAAAQDQIQLAQFEAVTLETVTVYGRAIELIGEAGAASEGVVGYADFEDRPLSRLGELVEVIPGVVATQHSGEGKANQYFLRGFNLDHGTDFSASLDGVPINLRSHGHGQGYLDLNFIIPEIIERVDFRKGPYRASTGDFSSAGSAQYRSYDILDEDFIDITVGEFGYVRGVAAGDVAVSADTTLLFALEIKNHDGPWELEQDQEKLNAYAKLSRKTGPWEFELAVSAYDSEWTATDQVPLRAIESGQIDRFGFIDPDLGGETSRIGLNGLAIYTAADDSETLFSFYAVDYDFSLFSNFSYFLEDAVNGDEFEQLDERVYYGAALHHERYLTDQIELRLGADARIDDISDIGLFKTASRQRLSTVRQDSVEETSLSLWSEIEIAPTETVRATIGLRGDHYEADITAFSNPNNGGSSDDSLLSPSLALAWEAADGFEFYANYGNGFHSNDVRGATTTEDPVSGERVQPVPILVRSEGAEIGARLEQGPWRASVAMFKLDLDSELVFVGDAGTTEVNDGSSRTGIEASFFWQPNDWLSADLSAAYTDAQFDISDLNNKIPGAVETVVSGGVLAHLDPLTLSARLRHFGEAPLVEDSSVKSDATTLVNLAGSYDWQNMSFTLEVLNVFDANDADITYFFESQLAGEPSPIADLHFHPVEPRQVRASIRYRF